jgi:hypothetical protein
VSNVVLLPNSLDTDTQFFRFNHLDLPYLDDVQLTDEVNYIRSLLWGLPADHWLRQRVAALERELISRKYTKR